MFFPEKIVSIKKTDMVLEVGPGGSPHPRSDVLLEKIFDIDEALAQRGFTQSLETDKKLVFYDDKKFPFEDNEFDYVICSHVLEHIPVDELDFFVSELQRVAKGGYIEYPTIYYEYLYNFNVHTTFLNFKNNTIYYMGKEESQLNIFYPIQIFFYKTLEHGYDEIVRENKDCFFQGLEWSKKLKLCKTENINELINQNIILKMKKKVESSSLMQKIIKKIFR